MYILKNAWISIMRNKGRNLLMTIIIVVIASACAITLSIRNSATKIVNSYEEKYNIEASIAMDRQALMKSLRGDNEEKKSQKEMIEQFNNIPELTVEEIDKYGDSSYVKNYYYIYNTSVNAKDILEATDSLVKETTTTETSTKTESFKRPPNFKDGFADFGSKKTTTKKTTKVEKIFNEKLSKGAFTLIGYNSFAAMSEFLNGTYQIIDGEVSSDFTKDACVISEELATLNDLKVGDTITLVSPNDTKVTYKVEITGIYKENSDVSENMANMFTSSANNIITNDKVIKEFQKLDSKLGSTITPTFILNNKDYVSKLEEEIKSKGLSEYYQVTNNLDIIEGATKSVVNVKTFATTFLIISLVIGCVVLLVLNMINIRERKYEIGVLRTIGMKKLTVISQFAIELLIVCVIGLGIGASVGAISSVKVANNLLASEIENSKEELNNIDKNFGGRGFINQVQNIGVTNIDEIDSMQAIVDFKVLTELFGIGILLTLIGSLAASISIARFSPLTILKERS